MCKDVYRKPETTPFFKHDCDQCRYLGSAAIRGEGYDYYFCQQGGSMPTILSRFGDEPSHYHSGLDIGCEAYVTVPYAAQGIVLAIKVGLIPKKPIGLLMAIPEIPPRQTGLGRIGYSQMILFQDENGVPQRAKFMLTRPDAEGFDRYYAPEVDFQR